MNIGTGYGIPEDKMPAFWGEVFNIQQEVANPEDRIPIYKNLIGKYRGWGLFRILWVMRKPYIDPDFDDDKTHYERGKWANPWLYALWLAGSTALTIGGIASG